MELIILIITISLMALLTIFVILKVVIKVSFLIYKKIKKIINVNELKKNIVGIIKENFVFVELFVSLLTIITFIHGITLLPNKENDFKKKLENIILCEQYVNYEQEIGIPKIVNNITYPSIKNNYERVQGYFTYNKNEFCSIIAFFKDDDSLFGYVVISKNESFKPLIKYNVKLNKTVFNSFKPYGPARESEEYMEMMNGFYSNVDNYITFTNKSYIAAYVNNFDAYGSNFYCEIFDMNYNGYLGLAYTDWNDTFDNKYRPFKEKLYEYILPENYTDEKRYLYELDDQRFKNLKYYFNEKLDIGTLSPNSFFKFKNVDEDIA